MKNHKINEDLSKWLRQAIEYFTEAKFGEQTFRHSLTLNLKVIARSIKVVDQDGD